MECKPPEVPRSLSKHQWSKDLSKVPKMQTGKAGLTEWEAGFRVRRLGMGIMSINGIRAFADTCWDVACEDQGWNARGILSLTTRLFYDFVDLKKKKHNMTVSSVDLKIQSQPESRELFYLMGMFRT